MNKKEIEKAKERIQKSLNDILFKTLYSQEENDEDEKTLLQYIEQLEFQLQTKEKVHEYDVNMIDEVKGESVKLYNKIDKLNKMIDEMAEQLAGIVIFDIEKDEPLILGDKEEVKQYFKEKERKDK